MADIQLDINTLLSNFAKENASVTQRAIIAEAKAERAEAIIDELATQVATLRQKYESEALEADIAAHGLTVVEDPAPEPVKPATRKRAAKKAAAPKAT